MDILETLCGIIHQQQELITSMADKIEQIQHIGGGGGSASIEDYVSNKQYKRNILLVDANTETMYRVIVDRYTSVTVDDDVVNGNLKLVGFENSIITVNHDPTQSEIDAMPSNSLVAIYSSTDTPYMPST